jgi:hypothetical protein
LPTWDRVQKQVAETNARIASGALTPPAGSSGYDLVRRETLAQLSKALQRPVVVYAVDCLSASPKRALLPQVMGPTALLLEAGDKDGFAEAIEELDGDDVAIMLQSPGGFAETADALVQLLRAKFKHVSFIVPVYAKSAATMLALSGNDLFLDENSELGPTDPQFTFGGGQSPARSIIRQFERARDEIIEEPRRLPAWVPILQQYAPSLLEDASEALALAQRMVATWLEQYMFRRRKSAREQAEAVARFFADLDPDDPLGSHGRPIGVKKCIERKLVVRDLRKDPSLRRLVREAHHAVNITLAETGAYKIVENSLGHAYIRSANLQLVGTPIPTQVPPPATA